MIPVICFVSCLGFSLLDVSVAGGCIDTSEMVV